MPGGMLEVYATAGDTLATGCPESWLTAFTYLLQPNQPDLLKARFKSYLPGSKSPAPEL